MRDAEVLKKLLTVRRQDGASAVFVTRSAFRSTCQVGRWNGARTPGLSKEKVSWGLGWRCLVVLSKPAPTVFPYLVFSLRSRRGNSVRLLHKTKATKDVQGAARLQNAASRGSSASDAHAEFSRLTSSSHTIERPRLHAIQHKQAPSEVALGCTFAESGGGVTIELVAARAEEPDDFFSAACVDVADATLRHEGFGLYAGGGGDRGAARDGELWQGLYGRTCFCVIDDHEMTAPRVLAQSTLRTNEASKRRGMCSATSSESTHVDASL